MPNLLQKAGAQGSKPARYGVLWHNNFYLGVVTQRNPLHSFLQHIEEEWYGNQPCLISGANTEISTALSLVRRPGQTVYNSGTFPAINRFYENRTNTYNAGQTIYNENIQVVADTASSVYDCTGPSTDTILFNKSAGTGSTFFQSVGNELFFSDGVDLMKYLTPSLVWAADTVFTSGEWVVDTNNNIQEVYVPPPSSATIVDINVTTQHNLLLPHLVTLTFSGPIVLPISETVYLTLAGLTTRPILNGAIVPLTGTPGSYPTLSFGYNSSVAITSGTVSETGTASYSPTSGTSGGSVPSWNATPGGFTTDGSITWQNMGSRVQNWQIAAPTVAPSVISSSTYSFWSPNSSYANYSAVLDANGNIEVIVAGGPFVSGATPPRWQTGINSITTDGTIYWRNFGQPGVWQPNFDTSGYVTATNGGCILDSNGNLQVVDVPGTTGATEPVWNVTQGGTTPSDGGVTWLNCGPGIAVTTGSYQWAYSYHGVDGSVTTASPVVTILYGILSDTTTFDVTIEGPGTTDPQCDQIWIWRTVQGGSTLFFDGAIPNPGAGTSVATGWTYVDSVPDVSTDGGPSLNEFIAAPIDDQNNPPPLGLTALAYHLNRVWGAVGNIVYSSQTSGITGNPYTAWDPEDFFEFPSNVIRLYPTSNGLIVFTNSSPYIIQGLGDASSSFFSTPFLQNIGLANYDAFVVNGAVAYMYTTDNQVVSMDPSSGFSEVGFPIGDQFGPNNGTGTFTPSSAYLTWNYVGSQEKALYVSDRTGNWWRMLPTPSPETGTTWCPMASIIGGFSAVQSVETSPGVHALLLGPASSGPILQRSQTVYTDNGSAYNAYAILGSLVLAQPGQLAYAKSITTDSWARGTPITLQVQLDEIAPLSAGYFESLTLYAPDPTQLTASNSVYAQRFYLSQTQQPAVCRHLQILISFGATDVVKNELLSLTVYGSFEQEN
jgi:hypothetical protein